MGLDDVSTLATKSHEIISKGFSGGFMGLIRGSLEGLKDKAIEEAEAKGIDWKADLEKLQKDEKDEL